MELWRRAEDYRMITQLSIFVRNKPGELKKVTSLLAENDIQIRAITVS